MRTSNRKPTDLVELIGSLSVADREAVREALAERKPRPAPRQQQLFEALCENPQLKDDTLLNQALAPNKNALYQLRYALYDAILDTLVNLRRSPKHVEEVERLLQQEKILFERNLFGLGLRTLNRARQYAEKYDLYETQTRIHHRLQDEYRFLADTDPKLKRELLPSVQSDLADFRQRVETQYERQRQEIFSLQVYWKLQEKGRPESESELAALQQFYNREAPEQPGPAADMHAVLHYNNNWAHLAMLMADWQTAFRYTQTALEAMVEPEQLRERRTEEVFSAVVLTANYLMVAAYTLPFEHWQQLSASVEQWSKRMQFSKNFREIVDFQQYLSALRSACINGEYMAASETITTYHSRHAPDWGQSQMVHARQVAFYEAMTAWGRQDLQRSLQRAAFYTRHPGTDSISLQLSVLLLRLDVALQRQDIEGLEVFERELQKLHRQQPQHKVLECFSKCFRKIKSVDLQSVQVALREVAPSFFCWSVRPGATV